VHCFSTTTSEQRIAGGFGLEGTSEGHPVQPLRAEQGQLPLDQAAQSPVQPHTLQQATNAFGDHARNFARNFKASDQVCSVRPVFY